MELRLILFLSLYVPFAASAFQLQPAPAAAKAAAVTKAPAKASSTAAAPEVEQPLPKNNKVTRKAYREACVVIVDAKLSEKKQSDANFCLDQEAHAKHLSQLKKATVNKCTEILLSRNRKVTKEILREKMSASFGDEYTIVSAIACPQQARPPQEMQATAAPAAPTPAPVIEKAEVESKFDEGRFGKPSRTPAPDGIDPEQTASTSQ